MALFPLPRQTPYSRIYVVQHSSFQMYGEPSLFLRFLLPALRTFLSVGGLSLCLHVQVALPPFAGGTRRHHICRRHCHLAPGMPCLLYQSRPHTQTLPTSRPMLLVGVCSAGSYSFRSSPLRIAVAYIAQKIAGLLCAIGPGLPPGPGGIYAGLPYCTNIRRNSILKKNSFVVSCLYSWPVTTWVAPVWATCLSLSVLLMRACSVCERSLNKANWILQEALQGQNMPAQGVSARNKTTKFYCHVRARHDCFYENESRSRRSLAAFYPCPGRGLSRYRFVTTAISRNIATSW